VLDESSSTTNLNLEREVLLVAIVKVVMFELAIGNTILLVDEALYLKHNTKCLSSLPGPSTKKAPSLWFFT